MRYNSVFLYFPLPGLFPSVWLVWVTLFINKSFGRLRFSCLKSISGNSIARFSGMCVCLTLTREMVREFFKVVLAILCPTNNVWEFRMLRVLSSISCYHSCSPSFSRVDPSSLWLSCTFSFLKLLLITEPTADDYQGHFKESKILQMLVKYPHSFADGWSSKSWLI